MRTLEWRLRRSTTARAPDEELVRGPFREGLCYSVSKSLEESVWLPLSSIASTSHR